MADFFLRAALFLVSERNRSYRPIKESFTKRRKDLGSEPHCLESGTGPASDELCALELSVSILQGHWED